MANDYVYDGLVEARKQINKLVEENNEAQALLEEAIGWISDIVAGPGSRDGDYPTPEAIDNWMNNWLGQATNFIMEVNA